MALAYARETPQERLESMWRIIAFCGRYGHQDAQMLLRIPMGDLLAFARALGKLIGEEHDKSREAMVTGGG
jgi:hypothetical protein